MQLKSGIPFSHICRLVLNEVQLTANNIRNNSINALAVVDIQVIGLEFFHPLSKPFRVCYYCLQILQVFMISDNCGCGAVLYISFPEI